jgi:protein O-GlcNAc transferase
VVLHYAETITPAQMLEAHRQWDAAYARRPASAAPPTPATSRLTDRLRIGFVGLDFSIGPTGFLALRGVESLDKAHCSVVCYCDRAWQDEYTARFRAAAGEWRDSIGLSDEELAAQVRRDGIDVLVDLGGHVGRRLLAFARRPARLQVTWLGYVGTTGLAAMDGLLADRFHVREGEEAWYTEKVLRMPDGYACYGPPPDAPEVAALPALQTGQLTFGCFNNGAKYSPQTLDAWAAVLRRVPKSRLLLKYGGLDQPSVQNRIRGQLADRGIAGERIIMEGWSEHREFLARYHQVDLALDTQPYSGGLTTCEALWMGVPVITWPGQTFAGRHSTSHMANAGYGQFVADDMAGYVELAAEWASRIDELAAIRAAMREQMSRSRLCDGPTFARNLLALLRHAWEEKG